MAFDNSPSRLESAHVQRDKTNSYYEQVNITGSDLVIYHDETGSLTADKIGVWATKYGIGIGGVSVSSSWASQSLSSSIIPYNGNRSIKRDDPDFQGINVGGNDVVTFLDNFFFPFVSATIAINSGTTYYETGSIQNIATTATITANDEITFGSGSIRKNGTSIFTALTIPPLSFAYTDNGVMVDNSYVGYAQTDNDGSPTVIASAVETVTFVYPFFYGLSSTVGLSGNSLYTTLTKDISPFGNKTQTFTGTNTYLYFAYPDSYIDLVHVLDPNLFQVLTSFEYSASVPVTSSGVAVDWSSSYKVYRWKTLADFTGGSYQFNYL